MSPRSRHESDRNICDWKMCYALAKLSLQSEIWGKWKYCPEKRVVGKLYRCEREASLLLSDTSCQGRPGKERRGQYMLRAERKMKRKEEEIKWQVRDCKKHYGKKDKNCFVSIQIFFLHFSQHIAKSPWYVRQPAGTLSCSMLADKKWRAMHFRNGGTKHSICMQNCKVTSKSSFSLQVKQM